MITRHAAVIFRQGNEDNLCSSQLVDDTNGVNTYEVSKPSVFEGLSWAGETHTTERIDGRLQGILIARFTDARDVTKFYDRTTNHLSADQVGQLPQYLLD